MSTIKTTTTPDAERDTSTTFDLSDVRKALGPPPEDLHLEDLILFRYREYTMLTETPEEFEAWVRITDIAEEDNPQFSAVDFRFILEIIERTRWVYLDEDHPDYQRLEQRLVDPSQWYETIFGLCEDGDETPLFDDPIMAEFTRSAIRNELIAMLRADYPDGFLP